MSISYKQFDWDSADKLGESLSAEVYLAHEARTNKPLLIKQIRPLFRVDGLQEHLEQQIKHLKHLDLPSLPIPELQIASSGHLQLVQAYPEGELLRAWLAEREQLDIRTVLEIAIALADCLVIRHRAALLHKAIKPNNILIRENPIRIQLRDEVQIIDAMSLSQFVNHPHYCRETLPYVAPEMSGRILTSVDYYSDLYSLGIVLYECLTGTPPFLSTDPLTIIHSHLAEQPRPIIEHNSTCPAILSDIVAMLLHKQADKRYQSAVGLRADLQRCLSTLESRGENNNEFVIPEFLLRQQETNYQITIPSIMLGREQEQRQLLEAYQGVCSGQLGIVTVAGLSGMGKTRLIQELEMPIVARHGYFTSGKFNQFSSHVPYSALVSAFSRLIRQILTEDSHRIAYWRRRMLDAVGLSGQLLSRLVPELEKIIGDQPDVQELAANDARNRFNALFSRFIACLCSKEHPLVLFVDDVQWCDDATFDLLELLCDQPASHPYLLIIGAFRSNEVGREHRINHLGKRLAKSSQPLLNLQIEPLNIVATNQMVAYILSTSPTHTEALTQRIYSITGGNPLHIGESLRWLHHNKRIYLSEEGRWSWDDNGVLGLDIPSNLTHIFVEKLIDFPGEIRKYLATAALLGAQFKAEDLADIAQLPLATLRSQLQEVFAQRILLEEKDDWYFFHDHIQAAAADFLKADETAQCHRRIANTYIERSEVLLKDNPEVALPAALLFSIVEHLAAGRMAGDSVAERLTEARFNYRAGVVAMKSLALDACLHYLSQSLALCPDDIWQSDYSFMFALHKNLARAALINGEQERANTIVNASLPYLRTDLDRADFLYEQAIAIATLGDLPAAIAAGSEALALLGVGLPVTEADIEAEILVTYDDLHKEGRNIWQETLDMPPVTERRAILIHQLYGEMGGFFYFARRIDLTRLISIRSLGFSAEQGLSEFTAYAMANMAYCVYQDDRYLLTRKYELATLKLVKQYANTFGSVKAMVSLAWSTLHLTRPSTDVRGYCQATAIEGIRCGELRYGGFAQCMDYWYAFVQGDDFRLLNKNIEENQRLFKDSNLASPLAIDEALGLSLRPLLAPGAVDGDDSSTAHKIEEWLQLDEPLALVTYYTLSAAIAFYQHQHVRAEQFLDRAEPFLVSVSSSVMEEIWRVFKCLVDLHNGREKAWQAQLLHIREHTSLGPMLRPYLALIEAEITVVDGDFKTIRSAYLEAIDSANEQDYILLEAFLNERFYQYLARQNHHTSEAYCYRANLLYEVCGVLNRVAHSTQGLRPPVLQNLEREFATPGLTSEDIDEALDTRFLLEAVATITSELDQDKLMGVILSSVMARLGAKTGYLLIVSEHHLRPYIKAIKDETVDLIYHQQEIFNTDKLCIAIANYVLNAKEKVVLDNAVGDGEFIANEDVQQHQLRSVLCLPLLIQQRVIGVLYFENNLMQAVFTESQIAHADVLTSQAAIALQNSQLLYETMASQKTIEKMNRELEFKVEERTKELQMKQLELSHAARLASLGELSTGIAHELGQPLQIIQVASRIIQDELEGGDVDTSQLIPFTEDIREQIERATGIIGNMRSYARSDDDSKAINTDLVEPFNQCLVFFKEQFHQHRIELLLEVDQSLPSVLVIPQKFQQIVVNLLSNARYAVDKRAMLEPENYAKKISARLYSAAEQSAVVLEVEDNGIGMSEEALEKCLNPFYTTKAVGEGTGLGLSIVHSLMAEFDFTMAITSEVNKGSLFKVSMPVPRSKNIE